MLSERQRRKRELGCCKKKKKIGSFRGLKGEGSTVGGRKKDLPVFFLERKKYSRESEEKIVEKKEGAFELSDHFTLVVSSCFLKVAHPCYSFDLEVFPRMKIFADRKSVV